MKTYSKSGISKSCVSKSWASLLIAFALILCVAFGQLGVALAADAESIAINQTKYLAKDYAKPLVLTAQPTGADLPEVTWQSSNDEVATVDDNGVVTGHKAGKATITATAKNDAGIKAEVTITVYSSYRYKIGWAGNFNQADNNQTTTTALPVDAGRVQRAWAVPVGNSAVAIVDDYVYSYNGTNTEGEETGGVFYKINKNTGNVEASLNCTGSCGYYYSYTIYGGGLLYVSCVGTVMAFDPDSFTQLWVTDTGSKLSYCTAQYVNGCVVTNGVVLDGVTGAIKAKLTGAYNYSSGVESGSLFYIASADGYIYAFDTTTWELKHSFKWADDKGGNQPGVALSGNRLYWGESNGGKLYSVQIATDGSFVSDSLKSVSCGVSGPCVPVIADGRVYLAGTTADEQGAVAVVKAADMSLQYVAGGGSEKIQSTPIVRVVSADGPVVSALSVDAAANVAAANVAEGNYVFVQDYGPNSRVLLLQDKADVTSGSLAGLFTVTPNNYAYEQLACDRDGALYVTNDSGYLIKYVEADESAVTYGDVNGDSKINAQDVAMLKRYVARWSVDVNTLAADVNCDGKINAQDVALLKRYVARWNVTLGPTA